MFVSLNNNGYLPPGWHVYDLTKLQNGLDSLDIPYDDDKLDKLISFYEMVVEKNKVPRVNLCNCSYQELYYVLKNSQIFISGRWHASILALLSGTPILLWGADSFKTRALYDLFNYPYAFIDIKKLPEQIPLIKSETIKILSSNIRRSLEVKAKELSVLSLSNYQVIE